MARIETYEKYIAELEEKAERLSTEVDRLRSEQYAVEARAAANQEKFFRGLLMFLTELSNNLSGVQGEILKNSVEINKHLAAHGSHKFELFAKQMQSALMLDPPKGKRDCDDDFEDA